MSNQWQPDVSFDSIPKVTLELGQCLPETVDFIGRLKDEMDFYFPEPDGDQIQMMIFHPLIVWGGFRLVFRNLILS
jgi:hypothetical protein